MTGFDVGCVCFEERDVGTDVSSRLFDKPSLRSQEEKAEQSC